LNHNPSKQIDRDVEEHYLDKDYGSPQSTNGKEMAAGGNGRPATAYFWRAAVMAGRPAVIPLLEVDDEQRSNVLHGSR